MKKSIKTLLIKQYFLLSILFLFIQTTQSQIKEFCIKISKYDPKSEIQWGIEYYDNLNSIEWRKINEIKECTIGIYKYKGNTISQNSTDEAIYKFNEDGNITEITYYKGIYRKEFEYENNKLAKIEIYSTKKNKLEQTRIFEYNNDGNISKIIIDNGKIYIENDFYNQTGIDMLFFNQYSSCNDGKFIIEYLYNENGKISQILIYSHDSQEYYRERYKYNENNKLIEIQRCYRGYRPVYGSDFSKIHCNNKNEYFYDSDGKLLKEVYYFPTRVTSIVLGAVLNDLEYEDGIVYSINEEPQGYLLYKYNENNYLIECQNYYSQGLESKTTYKYDSENNCYEILTCDSYGTIEKKIVKSFDDKKRVTMKMSFLSDNSIDEMYKYKYDENGTRTEIIEYDKWSRKPKISCISTFK